MKRLSQFLTEMKVIKGAFHPYWQVRTWAEVDAAFRKLSQPYIGVQGEDIVALVGQRVCSLRCIISGPKAFVWDAYHGQLHDDGAVECNINDDGHDIDLYFLETETQLFIVAASHMSAEMFKHNPTLVRLMAGCPLEVHYK